MQGKATLSFIAKDSGTKLNIVPSYHGDQNFFGWLSAHQLSLNIKL